MKHQDISSLVGNTPHLRVRSSELKNVELYVKLEGYNPTGSVKDRACVAMIRSVIMAGQLRPGMSLLDASSGNMACAIAFYGKCLGYDTRVIANSKLTDDKRKFIEFFDSSLQIVGDLTIEGNRECRRIADRKPDSYCFLDQLHNWDNPQANHDTTGPEILTAIPNVAMVVGSLGSGGSMLGVAEYLKRQNPNIEIVVVQAASGTKLPGTGAFDDGDYVTPFIQKGYTEGLFDYTYKIDYDDAVYRSIELKKQGLFCGLQTGGVFHAALQAIRELECQGPAVLISGDSGWKNMSKLSEIDQKSSIGLQVSA